MPRRAPLHSPLPTAGGIIISPPGDIIIRPPTVSSSAAGMRRQSKRLIASLRCSAGARLDARAIGRLRMTWFEVFARHRSKASAACKRGFPERIESRVRVVAWHGFSSWARWVERLRCLASNFIDFTSRASDLFASSGPTKACLRRSHSRCRRSVAAPPNSPRQKGLRRLAASTFCLSCKPRPS